jgi:hypothetical protein
MLCKDCLYFKQWKSIETAVCQKTGQTVETSSRPCDDFVSKMQLTDEWGESTENKCNRCG